MDVCATVPAARPTLAVAIERLAMDISGVEVVESVTVTENVAVPEVVGFPLILPVVRLSAVLPAAVQWSPTKCREDCLHSPPARRGTSTPPDRSADWSCRSTAVERS